jgi:cytochrome c oxidase subunit 4
MSRHDETSARGLAYTLLALLLLAGLSLALRFAQLGSLSFPVALGIAVLKALLVAIFFMELLTEKATVRFAFLAGLTLFALMLILVVADVLTRSAPPLRAPPGTAERYRG